MDPALPEIILNEEEAPDRTQSGFSYFSQHYYPLFPVDRAASQEEQATHQPVEPSFCPSESYLVMDEAPSQRASTVAEMPWMIDNSDQGTHTSSWTQKDSNQYYGQHLSQSLTGPIEPQTQTQDSFSSPSLQDLSPFARLQPIFTLLPELICTPCSPPDCCLLNMTPITSMPNSGFDCSPSVVGPVGNPTEFWYSPYSPPQSLLLLPSSQPNPSWCLCPQAVTVHQPCSPDPVLRRAAQQVNEQLNVMPESAASGREQNEEQAKPEEEQQKNFTPDKDKLQENYADDERTKSKVSSGSPPSLDEESLAERAFEEYMMIMDSLSPKIQEGVEAKKKENEKDKDEEKRRLKTENESLLDYLDELCSDENFIRNVESLLDIELLNSLFSADPEPIDLLTLEKQEQEDGSKLKTANLDSPPSSDPVPHLPPIKELRQESLDVILQQQLHPPSADSNSEAPVTEEASLATSHAEATLQRAQSSILDPPETQSDKNPNQDGQNASLSTRNIQSNEGSPLLSSVLEEPQPTDATTTSSNPVNATRPLHHDASVSMDQSFNSFLQPLTSIVPDISLEQKGKGNDAPVEEPAALVPTKDVSEASKSLSNPADTHPAQMYQKLQEGPLPGDPPTAESSSTSSVSGSTEVHHATAMNNPAPSSSANCLTVSSPQSAGPQTQIVLTSPSAQIREPDEQCGPKDMNPKSPCLEDYAVPVPANSSLATDSLAESCAPPVDGNLSDSVSVKLTVETPKGLQASQEFHSSGEWGELDRKCEKNLGKGVGTTETQKQTAIKATGEGRIKKTFERERQSKENETKLKGTANKVQIRRSQRLLGQIEKEKARLLSGGLIIRRAEEIGEISIKNTEKFIHERDTVTFETKKRRSSGGRQLSKKEESHFKERSKATEAVNIAEQFLETGEMGRHQKLAGGMQELKVEGGEQCEAKKLSVSTETGVKNDLLTKMTQEEKESSEERVKTKEEGIETSSCVRRTRSTTSQEARERIQHSEMERSEVKTSPEREMHEDKQLNATEPQTLLVSSQVFSKDKVLGVSLPESSPQSQTVQTDTHPTEDSIKDVKGRQESCEGLLKEVNESHLTSALSPETQQPCKAVTVSRGGVTGTENLDFYNLRSQTSKPNTPKGTVQEKKEAEATLPDQTAAVKADDERINGEKGKRPSLKLSPMKRYWHERGASEERETKVNNETEMTSLSQTKRGRWRRRLKVNSERDTVQKLPWNEKGKDEVETSGRTPSPPLTRGKRKAKHKKILNSSAGRETFGGRRSSAIETRASCNRNHIPCLPRKKQTRSSKKLPTKYKDFILCKTNRQRRQPHKEKGKARKGKMLKGGKKRKK